MNRKLAQKKQQKYYDLTASTYSTDHSNENEPEHLISLHLLEAFLNFLKAKTLLDIGAGTGRVSLFFKKRSKIKIIGAEPIKSLREIAYKNGLSKKDIINGRGEKLKFKNNSFDLVCCFGVLHHSDCPEKIIKEMLRLSKKGIFISDTNNYGEGSLLKRTIKVIARFLGFWPIINFLNTKGKGYRESAGDGISYSFSVLDYLPLLKKHCSQVYVMNTKGGPNSLFEASHVAVIALK